MRGKIKKLPFNAMARYMPIDQMQGCYLLSSENKEQLVSSLSFYAVNKGLTKTIPHLHECMHDPWCA